MLDARHCTKAGEGVLDVGEQAALVQQPGKTGFGQRLIGGVRHRHDHRVARFLRQIGEQLDPVFVARFMPVDQRVVDREPVPARRQRRDQIGDFAVAQVGHVLLEGKAKHQHPRARRQRAVELACQPCRH